MIIQGEAVTKEVTVRARKLGWAADATARVLAIPEKASEAEVIWVLHGGEPPKHNETPR